jgi:hypothetical protein
VRSGVDAASERTVVVSVPYSINPGRSQTAADVLNMALIRDVFNAKTEETGRKTYPRLVSAKPT